MVAKSGLLLPALIFQKRPIDLARQRLNVICQLARLEPVLAAA